MHGPTSADGIVSIAESAALIAISYFESCARRCADHGFEVEPGTYRVDVHRLFSHTRGEQFPDDDELPDGDHYVVVLTTGEPPEEACREIAWAPDA